MAARDVLLVSHDALFCAGVVAALHTEGIRVRAAASLSGVLDELRSAPFDAALLDLRALPAPAWLEALEAMACASPAPAVVAWGDHLTAFEGFQLGRLGVRKLAPRRPRPEHLVDLLGEAMATPPAVEPHLRALVGDRTLASVIDRVRTVFFDQALGLSRGSHVRAAQLLGVSRQAVYQAVARAQRARRGVRARRGHLSAGRAEAGRLETGRPEARGETAG